MLALTELTNVTIMAGIVKDCARVSAWQGIAIMMLHQSKYIKMPAVIKGTNDIRKTSLTKVSNWYHSDERWLQTHLLDSRPAR